MIIFYSYTTHKDLTPTSSQISLNTLYVPNSKWSVSEYVHRKIRKLPGNRSQYCHQSNIFLSFSLFVHWWIFLCQHTHLPDSCNVCCIIFGRLKFSICTFKRLNHFLCTSPFYLCPDRLGFFSASFRTLRCESPISSQRGKWHKPPSIPKSVNVVRKKTYSTAI